mmetsp:Transcript_36032/g.43464  ORF Transcript_36032/g.43464 Transcript_36032/m.43464 type:complete len:87 (+) Transcript_36032:109-369(+)
MRSTRPTMANRAKALLLLFAPLHCLATHNQGDMGGGSYHAEGNVFSAADGAITFDLCDKASRGSQTSLSALAAAGKVIVLDKSYVN